MIFRQLFETETSTFTYLLADEERREAVLIDPVVEETDRYVALLDELDLRLVYTLETHVHADHVTAGAALRAQLGSRTVVHADGGAQCADVHVTDGDVLHVGKLDIEVLATPGHTNGDVSYKVGDRLFTGDALLIGGCGRTDFQEGDASTLFDSVTGKLFTLPDETRVYPGHDYKGNTVSTIGVERTTNPRLGGKTREEFVAIMDGLNLSFPKRMARSVPANLRCGREPGRVSESTFAAISRNARPTGYGVQELSPVAAAAHLHSFRVVDVRESYELSDALGHIEGAENVPLATVPRGVVDWDRDAAVLVVCRSGGRSANAAMALGQMGFTRVFNLAGGMIGWNVAGLQTRRLAA